MSGYSNRCAVLIFANDLATDLAARHFPRRLGELLSIPNFGQEIGADVHLFTASRASPGPSRLADELTIHRQRGAGFGQRLENAVEHLAKLGYSRLVIVGRDCPQLTGDDILRALDALDSHRLVLGPDHRGGCWLIGFHVSDRAALLRGIQWQRNVDFDQLAARVDADALETLTVKFDLDALDDLKLLADLDDRAHRLLRQLLANYAEQTNLTIRAATLDFPRRQRPPPSLAA